MSELKASPTSISGSETTTMDLMTTLNFSDTDTTTTFLPSLLMMDDNNSCDVLPETYVTRNLVFSSLVYAMYGTIFVISLLGNVFVCYIVMQSPRMRTVTNYFIMNLSIGDILVTALCVPFTSVTGILQYWTFGAVMCPIVCYVSTLSVLVSAYTLVAISMDKYMLIMYPLKPRISKRFATCIIGIVWVVAGITVLPSGIFATLIQPLDENGTETNYHKCDKYVCQEDYSGVGVEYGETYTTVLMILQYIIPLIVLIVTYTSIAAVIWCRRIPGEAENTRDKRMARSKRKMVKMMITVVFVFTMCWLPFNMFLLLGHEIDDDVKPYVFFLLHGLAMSHACYNPIIYCYMNTRFRDGFFLILRMLPCCKRCYVRKTHGSMSSGFQHNAGLEGTDSTSLHRNNTFTTYITLNRKNRLSTYQTPARNASLKRNGQNSNGITGNSRRKRSFKDLADESI